MPIKKRGAGINLILNSKSQAAIFIIFALVVMLSGLLYFFYQRQAADKEVEAVQPEFAPLKLYVENCIKNAAEDGLQKIGLYGGYAGLPNEISSDPRSYLPAFPGPDFKIPYWWHDGTDAVPTEDFIRQQLVSYINPAFRQCINSFEPFSRALEINELKDAEFGIQFNENDVSINVKYPLEVISKDGKLKQLIQTFGYTVSIRFKKIYALAKLIMDRENKDYFLEKKTIDLYSMDKEIPTTDFEAACKTKTWQLGNIKNTLGNLLRINIPYIKIKGTNYNPNLYVPFPDGAGTYADSYYQQHYVWEVAQDPSPYRNMKVAFAYEGLPLNLYARPSENGILRSNAQKGTEALSFLCMQIWHFTYDINYPVLVTISDPETEKNREYQFTFAFKVNVDHNQPSRESTGTTLFEPAADLSPDDYCNDVKNEVTIFTVNNATGDDMRDVNLTFVCGNFYCGMGQSNWLSLGAAGGITKKFPYCVNGIIKGTKSGFADAKSFMQTDVDGRSYVLSLNPIKEFKNFKVVKHLLSSPGIAEELSPSEKASIQIKGKNVGYETFAAYPQDVETHLSIPDGKDAVYDVNIYLTDGQNIIGGYIGEWKVSKDALKGAGEVVFHAVAQGPATDDERFLFVSGLSSYSKNVPQPELK